MTTRIVIVDDHPMVALGLAMLLGEAADIEVAVAVSDPRKAAELIAEASPDVVLTDMAMPHLSGAELVEQLALCGRRTPVIVLSALHDAGTIAAAFRAGATNYLFKDLSADEIATAVVDAAHGRPRFSPEVAAALAATVSKPKDGDVQLSDRESAILSMVAEGMTNRKVARELNLSEATVKTYLNRCYTKLGVNDRASAVHTAMRRGILPR